MSPSPSPAILLLSPSYLCFFKPSSSSGNGRVFDMGLGLGFEWPRKKGRPRRRLKFAVNAELSKSFSLNFGLDSQNMNSFQSHDASQLPWIGPIPGDIAEIEAYCRIFRSAERLHSALMDALCNPCTGECSVSYDVPSDEKPQLEDKIVSVLGCMVSLMNKGREDILSGRSSVMNSFGAVHVSTMEDDLPPLAIFRSEMKRCCESLHVALENYLISDDDPSINVWRKLQRLKNICYDSGFPRKEHYPCHTLFANWSPVYFSTSKKNTVSQDSEAVFWTGGQVTEEGLKWLLDKGYKTIIDLRAETVKDNFFQAAIHDAISSGKIELIKIPVEVGTAPTMEQVVRFASYVSDGSKRPIYLHSKEGVWRTSAMISRWRQYITRFASQIVPNQAVASNDMVSCHTKGSGKPQDSMLASKGSFLEKNIDSLQENLGAAHGSFGTLDKSAFRKKDNKKAKGNGALNGSISGDKTISETLSTSNGAGSFSSLFNVANPLKAQVPPRDILSKRDMSNFIGNRKISPPSYFRCQTRGMESLQHSKNMHIVRLQGDMMVSNIDNSLPKLVDSGSYNGSAYLDYPSGEAEVMIDGNTNVVAGSSSSSFQTAANGSSDRRTYPVLKTNVSTARNTGSTHVTTESLNVGDSTAEARLALGGDSEPIAGNMCASSTGVVRVQSRKKAEMFLVRTDGYSCNREKVNESSLAFTHPSTQQQMLMWKSAPKTVLLLKKLGEELMEEAKEVASFLYHLEKMNVVVETDVHDIFAGIPGFGFVQTFYSQDTRCWSL